MQIVDSEGNVIAEVNPQFVSQVLEALPEGSYVPGGGEDMLPENYGEPSAAERHYYDDDVDDREEAAERRWQEEDLGDADDKNITFVGDKVQRKLDYDRDYRKHKIRLKKLKEALEDKDLEQEENTKE